MKKESRLPSASYTKMFQPSPHTSLQCPIQLLTKHLHWAVFAYRCQLVNWAEIRDSCGKNVILDPPRRSWFTAQPDKCVHRREPWNFIWTGYQHHCCSVVPANRTAESFYRNCVLLSASSVSLFGNFLSPLKTASGFFSPMPDSLYLNAEEKITKKKAQ